MADSETIEHGYILGGFGHCPTYEWDGSKWWHWLDPDGESAEGVSVDLAAVLTAWRRDAESAVDRLAVLERERDALVADNLRMGRERDEARAELKRVRGFSRWESQVDDV